MSHRFPRPRLVLSKCLELEACRYNGVSIRAPLVRRLEPFVELVPVCPEVEIGLGVPRDPVRLVRRDDERLRMVQPSTGRDLSDAMRGFSDRFLSTVEPVEGFLLKSRSPSCGIEDTKVYPDPEPERAAPVARGPGLFARAVLDRFADRAIEDEGRLGDFGTRHHFLTKLFTLARLRRLEEEARREGSRGGGTAALVEFHWAHGLLLTAYSRNAPRALGRIVANPERRRFDAVLADYRSALVRALARPPSHADVLGHALGAVEQELSAAEREHFLEALDEYRAGRLPLSAPLTTLESWIARSGDASPELRIYCTPYPRELRELADPGGRPHP